jgi:hypothetical protein
MMPVFSLLIEAVVRSGIPPAHAAPLPGADPCTFVPNAPPNCTTTATMDAMLNAIASNFGDFLVVGGGALCVLFTAIGGLQMLLSFGDESKFTRGRNSVIWALIGFAVVLGTQVIVNFVAAGALAAAANTAPFLKLMEQVVAAILVLMNVIFAIIITAAGIRAIIARGSSEDYTAAKKAVGFAIAGALMINLSRALAEIVLNLLG